MASRELLSIEAVLQALDADDSCSESEDEFDGYIGEDEYEEERRTRQLEEYNEEESAESGGNVSDNESVEAMDTDGPPIPAYSRQPGCTSALHGNDPINYFSAFTMFQHIVDQTNEQYADTHELGPRSRVRKWTKQEHTVCELKHFLALVLVMGIIRYPSIESHWGTTWPYATTAFSSVSKHT
jgi:hypothetical protein